MKTVSELQEALARFSPDARLSQEIDVQGPSPATDCVIEMDIPAETKEQIEAMEAEIEELKDERKDYIELFKAIRKIVDEMPEGNDWAEKIEGALNDADV